jgi:hypothetical protein
MNDTVQVRIADSDDQEHLGEVMSEELPDGVRMTLRAEGHESWSAFGIGVFDALCNLRLELEPTGLRLCVAGARADAIPRECPATWVAGRWFTCFDGKVSLGSFCAAAGEEPVAWLTCCPRRHVNSLAAWRSSEHSARNGSMVSSDLTMADQHDRN